MKIIRLPNGEWSYDPGNPLAPPGGFGQVFAGTNAEGHPVAIKRLDLSAKEAAHRELTIAADLAGRTLQNVIPILDAGQDAESETYYIVMPVAEGSLQDRLNDQGAIPEPEVVDVLSQIANGLSEVIHIVHRDLKPSNILLLNGRWSIGDFGIARFVEDGTSTKTLKECLSPHYAAPEQWRFERSTNATDVYALGCIAYALLTGSPPFVGDNSELQEKHTKVAPPDPPAKTSPQLRTLLGMMLRKVPESRPSIARIVAMLNQISRTTAAAESDQALDRLAEAAAAHEREQALKAAQFEARQLETRRREALAAEAGGILLSIFNELARRIAERVPSALVHTDGPNNVIRVGNATLELTLDAPRALEEDAFPRSKWDVVSAGIIEVSQPAPHHKRAASLWYTRRSDRRANYRWLECGYEGNPLTSHRFEFEPGAATPELADRATGLVWILFNHLIPRCRLMTKTSIRFARDGHMF